MALDITTARLDIAKIYIAAFDRAADSTGLDFWVSSYMAGTDTLTTISEKFTNSTEYKATYPSYLTKEEYVDAIYSNVFNRASDADGKAFWVGHLTNGTLTTGTLLKAMVDAASANSSTDGAMLTNQATYAVYAAVNDVDMDLANARLSTITSDKATLTAAQTNNPTNEAGVTNVLTTAQDVLTGTTGNDFYRAVAGATTGTQDQTTLNSSDIIDGSTGSDTLIVNMTGANYIGGARIKNIETLKIGTNLAAATFDYNVNMGANEITEVTKIVADQINTGETLTVNNVVKTDSATVTLSWENDSNTLNAGTVNYNYRAAELTGTADTQNVDLSNVANGVLNLAAGVETLSLTSNSSRNTLNNSTNADTLTNAVAADIISSTSLTTVVLDGSAEIGRSASTITTTGLTDRTIGSDTGSGATTESNLLSVGARVTTVDASAATGATNVRFTAKTDGSATNVTFKGGSAADYVEFELGDITATSGAGNDTFAFITNAASVTNSTFGAADNINGGAGTDTIQLGVNGTATYNIAISEFNNKTGIDVLDLRGNTNSVTLSSAFVAGADAGVFEVKTDKIVADNGTSTNENVSVSTIDLTNLTANQAIKVTGGAGSERVVLSDATFTNNITVAGGTNVTNVAGAAATNGDYDTITVVNSAIIDRNDLANVSGVESIVLTKNTTGVNTFRVELTEAFLLANTSATDSSATNIDDASFVITDAAAANGTALAATDTVTIDISDLLTSTGALKTSLAGRGIDTTGIAATVNYVVNGTTLTAGDARITAVTNAQNAGGVAALEASAAVTGAAAGAATGGTTAASTTTGNTFTLTAGGATLVAGVAPTNATQSVGTTTGLTANADTINGLSFSTATIADGTSGDGDAYNVNVLGTIAPTAVTGIENVNLTLLGGTFNAAGVVTGTGQAINLVSGTGSVSNVTSAHNLAVSNGHTGTVTLQSANTTGSGNMDYTIALNGTGGTLTLIDSAGANAGAVTNIAALSLNANSTLAAINHGTGAVTLQGTAAGSTLTANVGTVTAANFNASGNTYAGAVTGTFSGVTYVGSAGVDTLSLSGTNNVTGNGGADSYTITGGTTTIADWVNGTDVLVINAGATAGITAASSNLVVSNVTNNGTLTIAGTAGADLITGTAGVDSISGGVGSDILTGNGGNDTFVLDAAIAGIDTITDFAAGDILNVNVGTPAANTYFEGAAGAVATTDEIVIMTDATYANLAAVYGAATLAAASEVLVVFVDTATNTAKVVYDANGETAGSETVVAELTGVTTTAQLAAAFATGSVTFF